VSKQPLPKHFTASALVIADGHVLLVHHRRIGAWLPPGGHIDECELPHEAAIREVLEETGVAVEIVSEPMPQTGDSEAFFLNSPLCLHSVMAVEKGQAVDHLDLCYLCRPVYKSPLPEVVASPEVHDAKWVSLDDLEKLPLAKNVKEAVALGLARFGRR